MFSAPMILPVTLALLLPGLSGQMISPERADSEVRHVVVYYESGRFCGWPANNGMWSWGNEVLVGFTLAHYKEYSDRHSYDREKPRETVFARSLDGGETWKLERPPVSWNSEPVPCPGGIEFTHPDFAMRCQGDHFRVSYDRGISWSKPFRLPKFGQINIMPRTDYVVHNSKRCQIFLTATKTNGKEGRPFVAETRDAGRTIDFVSWISPEPEGFSIMPSTVRFPDGRLISTIRRYDPESVEQGWIEAYHSRDEGRNWEWLSRVADTGVHAGNPPSLLLLRDGRLAVTYGRRSEPWGIYARISYDGGVGWEPEIALRSDARTWDLGYTRTIQRTDGQLVTVYYYSTKERREEHIAATIWAPPNGVD